MGREVVMRFCEPVYSGEKAREHLQEYRRLLDRLSETEYGELKFYVLTAPANERNLMELIPAFHLKQVYDRRDTLVVLGLAADRNEAFELCGRILRDCYICHGKLSRELLYSPPEKEL